MYLWTRLFHAQCRPHQSQPGRVQPGNRLFGPPVSASHWPRIERFPLHTRTSCRDGAAAGAELRTFSPLADEPPDAAADAIWLPGGYPELHASLLSGCERFRKGLKEAAARGVAIHGECGGYMVLGAGLEDADGVRHRMTGLLGLETSFAKRKLHLGYRRARLLTGCALGEERSAIFGHEFHYASVLEVNDDPLLDLVDAAQAPSPEKGSRRGSVTGTFFHAIDGEE